MQRKSADYRTKRFIIRFTPDEMKTVVDRAEAALITTTDYIRTKALDQPRDHRTTRVALPEEKLLATLLGRLGATGSVLQVIADELRMGDAPLKAQADYALGRVVEASEAIMRALGSA